MARDRVVEKRPQVVRRSASFVECPTEAPDGRALAEPQCVGRGLREVETSPELRPGGRGLGEPNHGVREREAVDDGALSVRDGHTEALVDPDKPCP